MAECGLHQGSQTIVRYRGGAAADQSEGHDSRPVYGGELHLGAVGERRRKSSIPNTRLHRRPLALPVVAAAAVVQLIRVFLSCSCVRGQLVHLDRDEHRPSLV